MTLRDAVKELQDMIINLDEIICHMPVHMRQEREHLCHAIDELSDCKGMIKDRVKPRLQPCGSKPRKGKCK